MLKGKIIKLYKTFTTTACPFLDAEVIFNSKGLNHLFYKKAAKKRPPKEIMLRYNVLHLAPQLLSKTSTIQEYELIHKTDNDLNETKIYYYGFIAIIEDVKICVVVRKIGVCGKYHFWSIFPEWITSEKRDRIAQELIKG